MCRLRNFTRRRRTIVRSHRNVRCLTTRHFAIRRNLNRNQMCRRKRRPSINASCCGKNPSKLEIDASLRALTGPPPELGESEQGAPEQTSPSTASKQDHLSKADVINLSDSEARKRGYDLSRYDRPAPQFDPVDNTWSLSYVGKPTGVGGPSPKYFTVAVDDKTKRTAIVPGR